jgi:hypothetical protein
VKVALVAAALCLQHRSAVWGRTSITTSHTVTLALKQFCSTQHASINMTEHSSFCQVRGLEAIAISIGYQTGLMQRINDNKTDVFNKAKVH